jgi:hypothetical protein
MTIDPTTLLMLLAVMFIGGVVCGVSLMGLWCYALLIGTYRKVQNPFNDGSKRLGGLLGDLNNN